MEVRAARRSAGVRARVGLARSRLEEDNREREPRDRMFIWCSWEHQTRFSWHRMHLVPTGLVHREFCNLPQPPDASHRAQATGRSPSVRCCEVRIGNHRTLHTGHAQGTVHGSGACCIGDTAHQTHRGCVWCIVWCTLSLRNSTNFCTTFTQPSSNYKRTQISTNWNWYE